jgi:hypothetical protein
VKASLIPDDSPDTLLVFASVSMLFVSAQVRSGLPPTYAAIELHLWRRPPRQLSSSTCRTTRDIARIDL